MLSVDERRGSAGENRSTGCPQPNGAHAGVSVEVMPSGHVDAGQYTRESRPKGVTTDDAGLEGGSTDEWSATENRSGECVGIGDGAWAGWWHTITVRGQALRLHPWSGKCGQK